MTWLRVRWQLMFCLLSCLCWSGCLPPGNSALNEEKDPYFIAGQSKVNSMDYQGAIEAFEKALEANPRSASAHFELAILNEQKAKRPAAAIYHFEQFLKYRPKSDMEETVKQHILACKQELARTVFPGPGNRDFQREVERLTEENVRLQNRLKEMETQLAQRPVIPVPTPSRTTNVLLTRPPPDAQPAPRPVEAERPATTGTLQATAQPSAANYRTHVVKSGETPYGIAQRYGISVDRLMAANPRVNPTRMQIGQTLNIPPR
ncbi:MAG: LysM peptidoglycan-binding domain-containing protein [Verrucomicrobiota bacterium]